MTLEMKRHTVTHWDCGCITWIDADTNEYHLLSCKQDDCNVTKIVKEEVNNTGRKLVIATVSKEVV